jgi:hypothetical protein
MDLAPLTVPEDLAKARVDEYAAVVQEQRTAEDEAILQAYRAAARGLPIINLPQVIQVGGFFTDDHPSSGLPRLAIARADWSRVWITMQRNSMQFSDKQWLNDRGALVGVHNVRVDGEWAPPTYRRAQTVVPHVPPRHRPKRGRLSLFHILWEVEEWTLVPPTDPALLRHLRGDLWVVLATWDLTALERAVLSAR